MLLDAGLATSLEAKGCNLDDELWSARMLLDSPELIRQVHLEFLDAGADCITTATYQATLAGFRKHGLSDEEGVELLRTSVRLGLDARDAFWDEPLNRRGRLRPLVAASVGPYGAYLADGSEYNGRYGLDERELYDFHKQRWSLLAESDADLLACETIPSLVEAKALLRLLDETPERWAWLSFSCRDERHLCDGNTFADAVDLCARRANLAAIGVNCTAPAYVAGLIEIARERTDRSIAVYPNSGESYDPATKSWGDSPDTDWTAAAPDWVRLGASMVGGCCRTGAAEIAELHRLVAPRVAPDA